MICKVISLSLACCPPVSVALGVCERLLMLFIDPASGQALSIRVIKSGRIVRVSSVFYSELF